MRLRLHFCSCPTVIGTFTDWSEIQSAIINELYKSSKFPEYTAFLRTNKALYQHAYPVFITNYPLTCMPVKPGRLHAGDGLGQGDILKIVYPHDDERFEGLLFEEDWLDGMRTGIAELFYVGDDEDSPDDEGSEDHVPDGKDSDDETRLREDEADFDENEGFKMNEGFPHQIYDMDASLAERGEQFARYWIRKNPFAKLLRDAGRENVAKMKNLEITWGQWEANMMGELQVPGPYAVGLMSIVCSLFLPGLKHVTLRQSVFGEGEEEFDAGILSVDITQDRVKSEDERWPETLREKVVGHQDNLDDEPKQYFMIKAVDLLIAACPGLQVLELRAWEARGHSRWWKEMFETDQLRVHVEVDLEGPRDRVEAARLSA